MQKLAARGVTLIGVDLPSVDQIDSKDLPVHHALYRSGITILESLYLHDVAAGRYLLAAFPLRLHGGDAGPVRAVLILDELNRRSGVRLHQNLFPSGGLVRFSVSRF